MGAPMERRDDEDQTITRMRTETGQTERNQTKDEEFAADATGGRAGTRSDDEEDSSGLLGSDENIDTE